MSTTKSSLVLMPPSKLDNPVTSSVVVILELFKVASPLVANVPATFTPPLTVLITVVPSYAKSTAPAGLNIPAILVSVALLILKVLVLTFKLPTPMSSIKLCDPL